jgi:hypothetical protein
MSAIPRQPKTARSVPIMGERLRTELRQTDITFRQQFAEQTFAFSTTALPISPAVVTGLAAYCKARGGAAISQIGGSND